MASKIYSTNIIPINNEYANLYSIDEMERRRIEDDLRESEVRYRELAEGISNGVAVYEAVDDGEDFEFLDLNRAGEIMENVNRGDVIGRRVTEVFPGVREMGLLDVLKRVWRTGTSENQPLSRYKDDRIAGWRENYVYRLPTGEIVAVYDDVTEKKQAEEGLKRSEARYRLIAENMNATVWLMDLDLKITYISPSAVRARGYTVEELSGIPLARQMTQESFEMVMNVLESEMTPECLAQKDLQISHTFELEFYRKDGSRFWADVTMSLLRDKDGNPTSMLGVGRDITERRKARDALVSSEEKYRVLVETMREGLWTLDENAKITFVNPRMAEMLGYAKEEMLGKYLFDFMDEKGIEIAKENIERRRTGISEVHDLEFIRKDGSRLYASLATGPIQGRDGKYLGAIAGIQDITERKIAEQERMRRKTLESRYTLTKIMTDVVPALLTMGRGEKSKDEFMAEMMRRLDAAFYEKYFPTVDDSLETFGNRVCALMNDMGGEFSPRIEGSDLHITGAGCPWKNDVSRNPILCMIDRGLIERFANKALGGVSINQITSLANGDSTCEFVISKTG